SCVLLSAAPCQPDGRQHPCSRRPLSKPPTAPGTDRVLGSRSSVRPHSWWLSELPLPVWRGDPNDPAWTVWLAQQILWSGTAFSKHTTLAPKRRSPGSNGQ